jgi:hypothetical protein
MVTSVTQALGLFNDFHQPQGLFTAEWGDGIADDVAGMIISCLDLKSTNSDKYGHRISQPV